MESKRTILALIVTILSLPMLAVAQSDAGSEQQVAVSQKSMAELRRETYAAEEDFYEIYNKLNDDKEYDVRCFYEKPTGTNIKNHVCRAQFVTKAFQRHARRNRNNLSSVANQDADPVLAEKTQIYQAKMEALMAESPELQQAFSRYNTARVEFFAKREAIANN
ncbi:MAG: hypothetical protein ACR2QR_00760 [Woeseiaceae bacterium]